MAANHEKTTDENVRRGDKEETQDIQNTRGVKTKPQEFVRDDQPDK